MSKSIVVKKKFILFYLYMYRTEDVDKVKPLPTNVIQGKAMKNIQFNTNYKKAAVVIKILVKIDFKAKSITRRM